MGITYIMYVSYICYVCMVSAPNVWQALIWTTHKLLKYNDGPQSILIFFNLYHLTPLIFLARH